MTKHISARSRAHRGKFHSELCMVCHKNLVAVPNKKIFPEWNRTWLWHTCLRCFWQAYDNQGVH